ncbi:trans-2-enoyl-CoA reductase family protein [Porticoccus litoralis]|jgi:enoyl-[acyl-carrier protein] reductase/trans-2-enoyl-CoA reductase (NAD+)|uniref:Enoyl-[acyl-carrier-protein] reductase [NADH] n=1 Tax=Porticoccus litoralis TaxID=434086 RepID=A0AAW8AYL3_9GAMM|nr:enoyl-ACP reductase FabV [Porticoccus litoralis]MDP1519524.1 trans-2-enoyl-CoA reductase family protein [Porticoccus litoralis]
MIIKPRVRGFMCITTHPVGCEANVKQQIDYIKSQGSFDGPKRVLVIGASTGYGLAARITAAFGCGASTLGIFFEKEGADKKPGTAGWYNSAAFHKFAEAEGLYAKSINGDAFSDEIKQKAIETIKADLGQVDLVIYSLASPRRQHPKTGELFNSTLKPIGKDVTLRGINTDKEEIQEFSLEAASDEEIANTVAVMGGEDWQMWMEALDSAGVLSEGAKTAAFTYVGEKVTWDLYWDGTIGQAKKDLDKKVLGIREQLAAIGGDARVAVLKAVVTQASSAIPIMPLYLALLFKAMKDAGTHEGCIEQLYRLYTECLYSDDPRMDSEGRIRVDELELRPEIQQRVSEDWSRITTENIPELTDFKGYKHEFLKLFGFDIEGVDYDADVDPVVPIKNLV